MKDTGDRLWGTLAPLFNGRFTFRGKVWAPSFYCRGECERITLPNFTLVMYNLHALRRCGFTERKFKEILTCSSVARSISWERLYDRDFSPIGH
jgi:hypothetical protein